MTEPRNLKSRSTFPLNSIALSLNAEAALGSAVINGPAAPILAKR